MDGVLRVVGQRTTSTNPYDWLIRNCKQIYNPSRRHRSLAYEPLAAILSPEPIEAVVGLR